MRGLVVLAAVTFMNLGGFAAIAAGPSVSPDGLDVTGTARGRALAAQAAARWRAHGFAIDARTLAVRDYGRHGSIVGPRGRTPIAVTTEADGGATTVMATEPMVVRGRQQALAASASGWVRVAGTCWSRHSHTDGWIDACYEIKRLSGDRDAQNDYFELLQWATAYCCDDHDVFGKRLVSAYVRSDRHGGPAQQWADWDPRSDVDTACRSESIGITVAGFGTSRGITHCEMWDITKYAAAGSFRNTWRGRQDKHEREVAYSIAVKVRQGDFPSWWLEWNHQGG